MSSARSLNAPMMTGVQQVHTELTAGTSENKQRTSNLTSQTIDAVKLSESDAETK